MKTVQLSIRDSDYAQSLRNLLLRDGTHRVHLVESPDLGLDGVVVVDENRFHNLALVDSEPERFVVITRKGTDRLSRVWNAGIRHVVFEEDSPSTAQLAIIAAELRLPREGSVSKTGRPEESLAGRDGAAVLSNLPELNSTARGRKCGPKNAHPGF
jgi:hypothetical protein